MEKSQNIMNMIVVSCLLSLTISYLPLLSEYVEISNLSAILEKVFSMHIYLHCLNMWKFLIYQLF